ncbi:hypothetical protein A2865_03345 [Candidatus Woesebacteria bacterium RIFCSPHIGHO2_01_FULL_39_17]|uniref:Peptidase C45 hydrolase domain-containing protein n=1 Tax=Candidatus Woesebacteria bacterium GW2011_GWB1_39_10b TaxID=1618573 RepID=A0A0G0LQ74_9BACT|nr:MAG: hypothetical protein US72_C0010G0041 [Microgenomates group bacterium GW2011_GWC1_38_12]KKQ94063.1 MAG: hypothetical protein UT19_C0004G0024 [Candidatus Woesebacteria bacterium GW2011_GWB1_39_10b]OGM24364.1 MAG: hypothetical protein A2865_03345 [Candidatus Woesebacteria bacterium RIFCSPHIGHO2_01_FULL_39_17]
MDKDLPYYEIEGNYEKVGGFLGKTFRKNIKEAIDKRKKEIVNYGTYLPKSQECFEITKKYFPKLIIETEAIARGAGVSVIDYFFINNREVYDPAEERDKKNAVKADHCTVVVGFDENKLVIGHNEDWSLEAIDELYILKATINKTTFIGLNYNITVAGNSASMNNYGLTQCINDIYQTNKIGVPKNYVARAVLEARNLDEAENMIRYVQRGSGFNHVLAQGTEIRNIEIAGDRVSVQKVKNKPYVHTNHYLTEELKAFEKFHTKSSEERYKRANELLKKKMTKDTVISVLSDTENRDYPICRVDETIGSVVFIPDQLEAYFCYGHPCEGKFRKFSL